MKKGKLCDRLWNFFQLWLTAWINGQVASRILSFRTLFISIVHIESGVSFKKIVARPRRITIVLREIEGCSVTHLYSVAKYRLRSREYNLDASGTYREVACLYDKRFAA